MSSHVLCERQLNSIGHGQTTFDGLTACFLEFAWTMSVGSVTATRRTAQCSLSAVICVGHVSVLVASWSRIRAW